MASPFTDQEFVQALQGGWDAIATDYLEAYGNIQVLLDAETVRTAVYELGVLHMRKNVQKEFEVLPQSRQEEILELAFPEGQEYGY